MTMVDVDATVELVAELDRLSESSSVARGAPRSKAIYSYLARGMEGPAGDEFTALTSELLVRLGVWWSAAAFSKLPAITPWCVRDRSCRYDQGPESWGAPRSDGYMRDDNSIIKKLPLSTRIESAADHPYQGRKPWRGFTACHIWRDLPDGTLAGADPWLYSFMPNLIWLPSWLAPLTDRQGSSVQELLQRTSIELFRNVTVPPALEVFTEGSWRKLPPPPSPGPVLPLNRLAFFEPDDKFFARRIVYLDKVVAGCESVLGTGALNSKLICSRYTAGLPLLEREAVSEFRDAIAAYRMAILTAQVGGMAASRP